MIDLRSDTVTVPDAAMREVMAAAQVGDDVYGEDPTVNELEATTAELLGHEAGLFAPSGSMANQLGLHVSVTPGTDMIAEASAHVLRAEMGAAAALSGITSRTWVGDRGRVDLDQIERILAPEGNPYLMATSVVAVENTHNFAGGTIQPFDDLLALRALADERGVRLHLDGARLWNAHMATGIPLPEYGRLFETVSVCLSKGLGAPVGSVLVSDADTIARARVVRKRFGGGMRQVGILAAAALYALRHHLPDLLADHDKASRLAADVAAVAPEVVDPAAVETNIVVLRLAQTRWSAPELAAAARREGVRISVLAPRTARVVTHRDVSAEQTAEGAAILARLLAEGPPD